MSTHEVFAWGYWGWGEATAELVRLFDAVETSRGFEPPLLADVRVSRSVRATGFKDDAFQRVIGADRYRWLQGLGNEAVARHEGSMRLRDPAAAKELLSLVIASARTRQRVIFFCSCESPWAAANCHRHLVGTTLLAAAHAAGVPLTVQEWPGGGPPTAETVACFEVPHRTLPAIRTGKTKWASLGDRVPSPAELALPTGSLVQLTEDGASMTVAACAPSFVAGRWKLRLVVRPGESTTAEELAEVARKSRLRRGLEARHA